MRHYLSEEEIAAISNSINESITKQTYSKLSDSSVGDKVAHIAIASVLTSMDNELSALEAKRKKYEQIKQGMMQQLLTGRIRLN